MSNVRSMQRGMKPKAAVEAPPAQPPTEEPSKVLPLAGQNYRVRRLILKAELDVYTPDGVLVQRGFTDDLVLVEAEFPHAIMAWFIGRGMLKDGFKTFRPPQPPPPPSSEAPEAQP